MLKLGDKSYKVFVSLTDRKSMKFPCLIGRRFLYKFNYLIASSFNFGRKNKQQYSLKIIIWSIYIFILSLKKNKFKCEHIHIKVAF